jgi:hypothetical protein
MITTYFRSSSLNNWKYCELQYFMTYVLGHYSPSGKKADLGTITHAVLETLAICKKRTQFNKRSNMKIAQEPLGDFSFTDKQLYTDTFVNYILSRSFDYYQKNSPHNEFTNADYKFCEKMVWDTLGYNDGQFDPRNRKVIDTEPHFDIPILEDWAKFEYTLPSGEKLSGNLAIKGTIDLVTEADDGIIEVIDWKTGQRLDWATGEKKDYDKLMKDVQLLLYNYAISKMYPKYRQAIMTIFFCRDGGPFSLCFEDEHIKEFMDYLKKQFKEIVMNQSPRPISADRGSFKCKKLCHYYKNNWPGSDKSICNYVEDSLKTIGMTETIKNCTKPGFTIGKYRDPGTAGE